MHMVVRHKKEEVELQNELFVEAQCRSDRPGFALVDPDDRQVFNLYNAIGLQHQHEDLRTNVQPAAPEDFPGDSDFCKAMTPTMKQSLVYTSK